MPKPQVFGPDNCYTPEYRKATRGAILILEERWRQVSEEGWTVEHDAEHTHEELACAAACYASPVPVFMLGADYDFHGIWPWRAEDLKKDKHTRIRQLTIAGALCAAEIDRLLRLGDKQEANDA